MVAAAHPLAVDAGLRILEAGGSAADAAIATQLVLNLVEPQSSGLGGGAFLLHYDASTATVRAYDGRETAPAAARPDLFLRPDGTPMAFADAAEGGRAVGVPGLVRMLELVHRRHGTLPWPALFEPAIGLADHGYPLTPRTHALLLRSTGLERDPAARVLYFGSDGHAKPAGTILLNPAFAASLRAIAAGGADAFYTGAIAATIVAAVRNHPRNPGQMTLDDLAGYRARELQPLCAPYRGFRVCGMPPPSSGGIAVLQMLGMLAHFDLPNVRPGSAEAIHLLSEAGRLAYADRDRYVADDRYVAVPTSGLLDRAYLKTRAALIRRDRSLGWADAGRPPGAPSSRAYPTRDTGSGTSHLSIVDAAGNAVAMTTTIESAFGARIMAGGFLLNNQLTDFSFVAEHSGEPVANAVAPGKRPRSSMAPTLVLDTAGRLHMAVGSPGGSLIINYVAKALIATIDWHLDIQAAIDLPNFGSRNGPTEIERDTAFARLTGPLRALGHEVRLIDMTSGIHAIVRTEHGWRGGADPRREGVARGR